MKKIWVLVMAVGMSFGGFVRADEPKPVAVKPAAVKDDPITPAIKGADEKAQKGFLARHEGFAKEKAEALAKGPIEGADSVRGGGRFDHGRVAAAGG
jgi:hypothetical protein